MVLLQETKVRNSFCSSNKFKLGFHNAFVVNCDDKSEGLALLWKNDLCFDICNFSVNYIHGLLTITPKRGAWPKKCYVTRVYGHSDLAHRIEVWDFICNLGATIDKPWVVFGDFNEILYLAKKQGGRARPEKQISDFREFLTRCKLRDLGYVGSTFTWCNSREKDSRIYERLDRFLANTQWCELFPLGSVSHCQVAYSDHYPICLNLDGIYLVKKSPKLFRFKSMWTKEEDCSNIINDVWLKRMNDGTIWAIMHLIYQCGVRLSQWNRTNFGHVQQSLAKTNQALKIAQERHPAMP